jgi:hypothetical protein
MASLTPWSESASELYRPSDRYGHLESGDHFRKWLTRVFVGYSAMVPIRYVTGKGAGGSVVVKVLCYQPEGRGFETR